MNDLVWILSNDKSISFGENGISGSYILPREDMRIDPKSVAGRRIWVVLRGTDERLFLSIRVKKIEIIIEGYHQGDFILSSDLSSSFRLVSQYEDAGRYSSKRTRTLEYGLNRIELAASSEFRQLVKRTIQIKLTPPDKKLLLKIDLNVLPRSGRFLARSAVQSLVSCLNLDQIWSSGTGEKLSAFANFAHVLILEKLKGQKVNDIAKQLQSSDPLSSLYDEKLTGNTKMLRETVSSPKVDTEFSVIDPEKIYAREFLSVSSKFIDLEDSLNKTEHAEKLHQDMLKDIAKFLISKSITPYESGSIDLIFKANTSLRVCEIKSTTTENILAQSAKGSFQLACYIDELIVDYESPSAHLILQKIKNIELEEYIVRVLNQLGVQVLFYDSEKAWPMRVQGLLGLFN